MAGTVVLNERPRRRPLARPADLGARPAAAVGALARPAPPRRPAGAARCASSSAARHAMSPAAQAELGERLRGRVAGRRRRRRRPPGAPTPEVLMSVLAERRRRAAGRRDRAVAGHRAYGARRADAGRAAAARATARRPPPGPPAPVRRAPPDPRDFRARTARRRPSAQDDRPRTRRAPPQKRRGPGERWGSVAVVLRLVRAGDVDADVLGLLLGQRGQLGADRVEVQPGDLLVEVLGQRGDGGLAVDE